MKKKLFAMFLSLVMILSSVSILSEVSFAEGENEEAVVLNEEETIYLGEEKISEAVGAPADFDLATINTIAKGNDGKYYGVKTTGKVDDFNSGKMFYPLTKEQYDEVAKDCFMTFKREDGEAFEIPSAKLYIDSDPYNPQIAGKIFTELQFRHHEAFQSGIIPNNNPTRVSGVENVKWQIDLKDDWIIQTTEGFKTNQDYATAIDLPFNVTINGNSKKIYRTKGANDDRYNTIMYLGGVNTNTANLKNLIIDGSGQYRCVIVRAKGILNVGGSDKNKNEGVEIKNGISKIDGVSGGITLGSNTTLNVLPNSKNTNLKISKCIAPRGGAIYSSSARKIDINNSVFSENKAGMGGVICSYGQDSDITIKDSVFSNNKAETVQKVGGAIFTRSKLTIEDCEFNGNTATNQAGAILFYSMTNVLTIKGSTFTENKSTANDGGAIYTNKYNYASSINLATDYQNLDIDEKTTFTNNSASGYFNPPENVKDLKNIKFKRTTFTGTKKINPDSPLNNYDINYKRDIVVTYDPNDGNEVFEDKQTEKEVKGYIIKSEKDVKFTNTAKFLGWSEDKNSTKPEYKAEDKIDLSGNLYLYAIWGKPAPKPTEPSTVILTLDENHRSGEITNIEVNEGELIEPHLYIPRRRGYIFKGWSYDRKHLDEVKPGDRIYTDTVLYAIWKRAEIEKEEEPIEIKGDDHKAYIFGYPNGSVRPNGSITRAEAAAMLARLLNIEAIGSAAKPQFADTDSSWYNKAINVVVFRGIMKGYPDGRFRPNAPITRAEFTQMISTIDNKPYGTAPFADVPGHWAERAIGSEYQAKRITGYPDGLFRPDANITRAEAAVILNKIFERKYDNLSLLKCKNPQMIKRFTDLDESFWGWNDMVEATNTHEYVRRDINKLPEDWLLIK